MKLLPGRRAQSPKLDDAACWAERELIGFEDGDFTFVIPNFKSQFLVPGITDAKRRSKTFTVGGFTWSVMVALHEAEGTWGVAAYLTLMNKGVAPNDVLPFVYCTFTVLNHSKAEKNIEQDFSHQYEEDEDKDNGEEATVESWGWHSIFSRDRMRRRTHQFLRGGALHMHAYLQVCLPDVMEPRALHSLDFKRSTCPATGPYRKRKLSCIQDHDQQHHTPSHAVRKRLLPAPVVPQAEVGAGSPRDLVAAALTAPGDGAAGGGGGGGVAAAAGAAPGTSAGASGGSSAATTTATSDRSLQLEQELSHTDDEKPAVAHMCGTAPSPLTRNSPILVCAAADGVTSTAVTSPVLGTIQEGACPKSEVKISGSKVTIIMPVTGPGSDATSAELEHLHCAQLLFKHLPSMFDWCIKMSSPSPCVVTSIKSDLVAKLPLLDSMVLDFQALPMGGNTELTVATTNMGRKQKKCKSKQVTRAPFDAPASACGLACMLLMLEGSLTPDELFGVDSPHGPSLASQTLWMANYVGQKEVENTLHLWMGAVLCLLAMDKAQRAGQADTYKDPDLDRMLVSLNSWSAEWHAALGCIPPESVSAIVTGGPAGTLWSPRCLRGAATSQFSMLRLPNWITEAWLKCFSPRLDLIHSDLPLTQSLKLLSLLPCNTTLRSLHLSCKSHCCNGSLAFLSSFQNLLVTSQLRLPNLTVLDLQNVLLLDEQISLLSGIFSIFRGQLVGLGLTVHPECRRMFSSNVDGKMKLFEAMGKLSKLRVLLFPQWKSVVRKNVAVISPLKKLSRLVVLVHQMLKQDLVASAVGVVPGLDFKFVPERKFDFEMDHVHDD